MIAPAPRPLHHADFTPLVGRTLWAQCDPNAVELELMEATPLVNRAELDRPPFILIFRSAPKALLVSATYQLHGHGFGPEPVDLIQIARPASGPPGHYYQAVFN
jgi:hypothetical protein